MIQGSTYFFFLINAIITLHIIRLINLFGPLNSSKIETV